MIQRLQSLHLLIVLLLSATLLYGSQSTLTPTVFSQNFGFLSSPIVALLALFLYKKRPIQALVCLVLIGLQLVQLGFYVPHFKRTNTWGWIEAVLLFSFLNMIFAAWARRLIRKDEALVRSIDRIR